ncbi:MAG: hypothetical protein NZ740_06765 [Kiritimatiellae bacterium]|nr:hypothetical protein [Kiritimatiellia bacterium]MDW8458799.1 hypothetical protein [Verrucomicrobiota bacterium]
MKIGTFVGINTNAFRKQIWAALITKRLLKELSFKFQWGWLLSHWVGAGALKSVELSGLGAWLDDP